MSSYAGLGANIARLGVESILSSALRELDLINSGGLEGQLKGLITRSDLFGGGERYEVRVTSDVYYGRFMEYGSVHHSAHPFLRPAVRRSQRKFNKAFKGHAKLRKWR